MREALWAARPRALEAAFWTLVGLAAAADELLLLKTLWELWSGRIGALLG